MFSSDKLSKPAEFSGLFSARLDFTVNKMDVDVFIMLYELTPSGDYVRLLAPGSEFRASYAADRVHRHLLKAGERQQLTLKSERMTSWQLQTGSRVVMVLGINKRSDREINYGTGGDVSEESMEDAKVPLKIRWQMTVISKSRFDGRALRIRSRSRRASRCRISRHPNYWCR